MVVLLYFKKNQVKISTNKIFILSNIKHSYWPFLSWTTAPTITTSEHNNIMMPSKHISKIIMIWKPLIYFSFEFDTSIDQAMAILLLCLSIDTERLVYVPVILNIRIVVVMYDSTCYYENVDIDWKCINILSICIRLFFCRRKKQNRRVLLFSTRVRLLIGHLQWHILFITSDEINATLFIG